MRTSLKSRLVLTLAALAVSTPSFGAGTLYDELFNGPATEAINGTPPNVDNNGGIKLWVGQSGFKADGSVTAQAAGKGIWLQFTPTIGDTYTLSASLTNLVAPVATDFSWFGLGFSNAIPTDPELGDNRFTVAPTLGRAWMLVRGNNNGANPNQWFLGNTSGTQGATAWTGGPSGGGNIDLRVVLKATSVSSFTTTYFAKLAIEPTYTQVSASDIALTNTNIGAVGLAYSSGGVHATLTRFTLETSGNIVVPGDVNGNGSVDALDYGIIRDHLFNATALRGDGDLNADGIVNFKDFRIWKTAASGAVLASVGLPEPSSLTLVAVGLAALVGRARSKRTAFVSLV